MATYELGPVIAQIDGGANQVEVFPVAQKTVTGSTYPGGLIWEGTIPTGWDHALIAFTGTSNHENSQVISVIPGLADTSGARTNLGQELIGKAGEVVKLYAYRWSGSNSITISGKITVAKLT